MPINRKLLILITTYQRSMAKASEKYIRSASIGRERDEWLSANPQINFSALARNAIDREMKRAAKKEA
jgi:hypothetical protein